MPFRGNFVKCRFFYGLLDYADALFVEQIRFSIRFPVGSIKTTSIETLVLEKHEGVKIGFVMQYAILVICLKQGF